MTTKLKNIGLWIAIFALLGVIVTDFTDLSPEKYQTYVDLVLGILIAAGIISNPKDGKWFTDNSE